MGFFHKTEYIEEVIPEITGKKGTMVVTIRNMPYRREVGSYKRKLYPDFGSDLHYALFGKINRANFDDVESSFQSDGKFVFSFRIRKFAEMTLEISGSIPNEAGAYGSDLLDAIMDAWKKNGIER